jgi:hypothetical protein
VTVYIIQPRVKVLVLYTKIYVTQSCKIHRRAIARFLDSHKIGSFTEEQLMKLQESPIDEFGTSLPFGTSLKILIINYVLG